MIYSDLQLLQICYKYTIILLQNRFGRTSRAVYGLWMLMAVQAKTGWQINLPKETWRCCTLFFHVLLYVLLYSFVFYVVNHSESVLGFQRWHAGCSTNDGCSIQIARVAYSPSQSSFIAILRIGSQSAKKRRLAMGVVRNHSCSQVGLPRSSLAHK